MKQGLPQWLMAGRWSLLFNCLLVCMFLLSACASSPAVSSPGMCISTETPHQAPGGNTALVGVTALSSKDVWVSGTSSDTNDSRVVPLMEHWDGTSWSVVQTADTSALLNSLLAQSKGSASVATELTRLAAVSTDDIWAVGFVQVYQQGQNSFRERALIEHWDGQQWKVVPGPSVGGQGEHTVLNDVVALSANDLWAVGSHSSLPSGTPISRNSPLVEHWDGSSWQLVQVSGSLAGENVVLSRLAASAPDDVWAIGQGYKADFSHLPPPVVHWDGRSWSQVELPATLNIDTLDGVVAISTRDVWAMGSPKSSGPNPALIIHWDGRQWSRVASAAVGANGSYLLAGAADGANDVWAAGILFKPPGTSTSTGFPGRPLVEHWDGSGWQSVAIPGVSSGDLAGVAMAGGKIWTVGNTVGTTGTDVRQLIVTNC
jgi:hypothetical protein